MWVIVGSIIIETLLSSNIHVKHKQLVDRDRRLELFRLIQSC